MKHRNKRIGLELYPINTLKIFCTKWFKAKGNKISENAKKDQKGKWRKWAQYLQSFTDNSRVKSRTMRFLTFLHFLVTHTLKWAGLPLILLG